MRAALLLALVLAACGEPGLKAAGEPCVASSECAAGLVCNLTASPAVCADHLSADATVIDAGPIDGPRPADAAVDAPIDAAVDAAIDAPPAVPPGP